MKYLVFIILVVNAVLCYADLPQTMSYQGVLTDSNGNHVADGSYTVGFGIHNSPGTRNEGTRTQLWSETQTIMVTNGQFRATLGSVNPLNLPFDEPYWLAVTINGSTLTPYSELTSVPFSFNSRNSTNADSLNKHPGSYYNNWNNLTNVPSGFADGSDNSGSILYDAVVATSGGDYTSLEAAIAAGHKTIYVRKGTYTNTEVLTLPSDTVIIGESWTESIISGYTIHGSGSVTLKNIKLTCNVGSESSLDFELYDNCLIEHVWIDNSLSVAVWVGNYSIIRNCYVKCNEGIRTGQNCIVEGNFIISNVQFCQFLENTKVINNKFEATFCSYSISALSKCIISNNILTCSNQMGFCISASSGGIIQGNRIEGFATGIIVYVEQDGITISDNIVKSCGGNAFSVDCSLAYNSGPITLTGNIAWHPSGIGFYFSRGLHILATNNSVFNAGSDGFFINEIGSSDVQLIGNSARFCLGKGFNISGGTYTNKNWIISNNEAVSNSSDGFCMYMIESTVSGNISTRNTGYGFYFPSGLQSCTFTGNNSCRNGLYGFYATGFWGVSGCNVTGNIVSDSFQINGQTSQSVIMGDHTPFYSPATNGQFLSTL